MLCNWMLSTIFAYKIFIFSYLTVWCIQMCLYIWQEIFQWWIKVRWLSLFQLIILLWLFRRIELRCYVPFVCIMLLWLVYLISWCTFSVQDSSCSLLIKLQTQPWVVQWCWKSCIQKYLDLDQDQIYWIFILMNLWSV